MIVGRWDSVHGECQVGIWTSCEGPKSFCSHCSDDLWGQIYHVKHELLPPQLWWSITTWLPSRWTHLRSDWRWTRDQYRSTVNRLATTLARQDPVSRVVYRKRFHFLWRCSLKNGTWGSQFWSWRDLEMFEEESRWTSKKKSPSTGAVGTSLKNSPTPKPLFLLSLHLTKF